MRRHNTFRPYTTPSTISCGVTQLSGLYCGGHVPGAADINKILKDAGFIVEREWDDDMTGMSILFSDTKDEGNGDRLVEALKKYDMGRVVECTPEGGTENPNSGNMIKVWLWIWNGKKAREVKEKRTKIAA